MDPQATFNRFRLAVAEGDYDSAAAAQADYGAWRRKGGFPAEDDRGDPVHRLDHERDRYLALADGGREVWRRAEA